MTLAQINVRLGEITRRMTEISAEAGREGTTLERMQELDEESSRLNEERRSLTAQRIRLVGEANEGAGAPVVGTDDQEGEGEDAYGTLAYRRAFKNYVMRGIRSPLLKRTDAKTGKSDITSVIIPTPIVDKLYEKDSVSGSIFARVHKTNYPQGIGVPKLNFTTELTWVAENGKPDRNKVTTGTVTFSGYKGQIRISISLEARTMSLELFESALIDRIKKACARGFDKAIVAGSGSNAPTGILTASSDGAIYSSTGCNAYTLNNVTVGDHSEWIKLFAKIPVDKENGCALHINKKDWYSYIIGMKDENGRVVAFDRTGIDGKPVPVFMGMDVVLMENQGMSDFDSITGSSTKSKTTAFAYFFDDDDYVFNSNLQLTLKEYVDEESDETIHKATVVADGKVIDNSSLIIVCRGANAS